MSLIILLLNLINLAKSNYDYTSKQESDSMKCNFANQTEEENNIMQCRGTNFIVLNLNEYCNYDADLCCNISIYKYGDNDEWNLFKQYSVDDELILRIEGLLEDKCYKFSITECKVGTLIATHLYSTLPNKYNLSEITYSQVDEIYSEGSSMQVSLVWQPVKEYTCQYKIIVWNIDTSEISEIDSQVNTLPRIMINNIKYSTNYNIGIKALSGDEESEPYWLNYVTPSCIQLNGYDYNICVPDVPRNITIESVSADNCELVVSWNNAAPILPDYYLMIVYYNNTPYKSTLPPNETSVLLSIDEFQYDEEFSVYVSAVADRSGSSETAYSKQISKCKNSTDIQHQGNYWERINIEIYIKVCLSIFAITLTVFGIYQLTKRRMKKKIKTVEVKEKEESDEENITMFNEESDEYEILSEYIDLYEIIGEGEFGVVRRAMLKYDKDSGDTKEVAVKMLRDKCTMEDRRQFVKEVKVLKSVGFHNNIVSLIGYCSTDMLLVVEYCSMGDLLNYLRQIWKASVRARELINSTNLKDKTLKHVANAVNNILYEKYEIEKELLKVSSLDLISFARQIATGMEYLAKNRVIHRDLAARNVLLTSNRTAKISDFGLSRDVYEQNMYRKKTTARLPIKWMALESLVHHVFTTQSDVWSFGILLWEIMTLGCCPYPSLQSATVFQLLMKGYRMEKPPCCSDKLYDLMLSCWQACPQQRPSFTKIVKKLEEILETESTHDYLHLLPVTDYYYTFAGETNDESNKKEDNKDYK